MATEDLRINIKELQYDRQRLSALVFQPLQEIKDFVARNLRLDEVDHIVLLLRNAIRSDTLRTLTDGEALIAVLNLYYGKDNLRVVQRLLKKINCHDLLQVVSEWESRNNPVHPRVFQGTSSSVFHLLFIVWPTRYQDIRPALCKWFYLALIVYYKSLESLILSCRIFSWIPWGWHDKLFKYYDHWENH